MREYDECRSYTEHLHAEHRRLHRLLTQMRASVGQSVGTDGNSSFTDVTQVLRGLREELQHHFAEEEAGGCLDEAVSRCPKLSTEVRRIENEHPELLATVDRLIVLARAGGNPDDRQVLNRAFDNLCRQLEAHEAAENKVLSHGFGINVECGERCVHSAVEKHGTIGSFSA